MKLGINLSSVNYGESDVKAGDTITHGTGWSGTPATYRQGSRFLPGTGYMLPDLQGYRRAGTYTLQCAGNGTLKYADTTFGYPEFRFGQQADGTFKNSYPLNLKGGQGLGAIIYVVSNPDATNEKLGLRDLQFLSPGAIPGQLWHPQYLQSLAPFSGGLRTYDWMAGTMDTGPGCTWENRIQRKGFGIEAAVDLCNATKRDMWICMPVHCLTAQGITDLPAKLGAYLAANLHPGATVRMEVGDEDWNGGAGYGWQLFGYLDSLAKSATPPVDPATGNPMASPWELLAYLTHAAREAMRGPMEAAGITLKSVLSGQCTWYGNSDYYTVAWSQREKWPFDEISCAPYATWPASGLYTADAVAALWTAGNTGGALDLISAGLRSSTTTVIVPALQGWQKDAQAAGVPLVYYEMGLDYSALWSNTATAAAARAFSQDQRASELATWFIGQVSPFAQLGFWENDCGNDVWGSRHYADDTATQIRPALLAWASSNP